ncbi:MAG: FAD-binding oxidoreductase [Planctomycetaceae bacterium]|nr:FAD-binding oxidoreductase [Planctomycetaceae bacterium]
MDAPKTSPLTETITPADAAALADAVRAAAERGLAVRPVGGGTVKWPHAECEKYTALSMAKLNRVIDYPAADMTITVEAGMTIAELNRQLAANRQWLPIDVPWPDRATVGGAIAVNAAGPRRYAYGSMRDYLLGFTAVDGSGVTFSGGGRVVKNAAGYNMCRLMAGSHGALGIITQATLMVRPMPEASALLACEVGDFDLAEKLLAGLIRMPVQPVAVELTAGRPQENNPLFGPVLDGNVCRLCVGFEGSAAEVEWMLNTLQTQWSSLGMTSPVLMPNLATDRLWRWTCELAYDVQLHLLPSQLIATIRDSLANDPACSIHAHAGDGIVHIRQGLGMSVPTDTLAESDDRPEHRVIQAIKDRFDPKNILNPFRPPQAPREDVLSFGG